MKRNIEILNEDAAKKVKLESEAPGLSGSHRRSARLASKPSQVVPMALMDSDDEMERGKGKGKAVVKTRKASKKKVVKRKRNTVGKLDGLLRVPFDILCEIASNLEPRDLLNMARSFKALRALLTTKDSKAMWRAAREAMELPDCPPDLSEMQYADLLFDKGCYSCGAPRAQRIYFSSRLRLCKSCADDSFVTLIELTMLLPHGDEFGSLVPCNKRYSWLWVYHFEQAEKISNELERFVPDSEEYCKFIAEKGAEVFEVQTHAKQVETWLDLQERKRIAQDTLVGEERRRMVVEKLKMKGYTDMDLDTLMDPQTRRTRWSRLLEEPKPLTDRIWKNLEPKLEDIISERRRFRSMTEELFQYIAPCPHCDSYECTGASFEEFMDTYSDDGSWDVMDSFSVDGGLEDMD